MKIKLIYHLIILLPFTIFQVTGQTSVKPELAKKTFLIEDEKYPFWGPYTKTPISEVKAAKWITKDMVNKGWDWSLPDYVQPALKSNLCIYRVSGINKEKLKNLPKVNFNSNPVVAHWINWKDLEPEEGKTNFQPLIENIKFAQEKGYKSIIRIHFSSPSFAPDWLKKYNIPLRIEKSAKPKVVNYEISHPEFHKRYLSFIEALGKSQIPKMDEVSGLYLGYASPSYGDEGIGPYPEKNGAANDTIPHVLQRIDAWANACKGVEYKVTMGGISNYGLSKGFGIRRGFVEMYLYHIPSEHIGQNIDTNGYLYVDETKPIIANNVYNGDENEEYDEKWASEATNYRFGKSTVSFPYRYFTANLRLLQMRCNDLLNNDFAVLPEMLAWVGLELGRTIKDAPDAWCFLRESYLKENKGTTVKNFERWVYQRDKPGYETKPAIKIEQPIQMWMVQPGKYYDYIAREGKKIGFDIEDSWIGINDPIAIKISYFDNQSGELNLLFNNGKSQEKKTVKLIGDKELKTATFFISKLSSNKMAQNFDFVLEAGKNTENIVVSFIRVIKSKPSI